MKETLNQRIERLLQNITEREKQLNIHTKAYADNNNWEDAMKCDIKARQFASFRDALKDALK